MSLTKYSAVLLTTVFAVSSAHAQRVDDGSDRFFGDKVLTDKDDETARVTQGSITSTTFAFRELGGDDPGQEGRISNYSGATRLFTDLRTQLDLKRPDGKGWRVRADARVRISPGCAFQTNFATIGNTINCRTQSGTLGGNEYSIRELYAKKTGAKTDLYLGRQYVPELAATKIDGLQFQHQVNKQWKLIGFGGLHPSRISRSLLDDYPKQVEINGQTAGPVLPIAAGMGGAYRTPSLYGSVGAVGIVPIANDRDTGLNENPRVFLTDNGYWRASGDLDVYHYLVFDLQSAAGLGLTNLSLGANYRPAPGITVSGAINRVDTETLNSIAQTEILEVPVNVDAAPYNYQKVLRVASDSAHLGVSAALARQRFEVSGRAFFRQREELQLIVPDENDPALEPIPAARSAEARISVLDRRSVGGMRLGLSFSSIIPISKNTPNRSTAQIVSITGSRMFMDDRMELDSNLTLVSSSDIKELGQCMAPANQIEDCYGNSDVLSVHTNNLLYYRFSSSWLGIANIGLGIQKISTDGAGQPINLLISGLVRAAYRF